MVIHDKKESLIKYLVEQGHLLSERVTEAFRETPREAFLPESLRDVAYSDEPLPIGSGQTVSAPHMVAIMTELLKPKKNDTVLEVGSGCGYQAAILSRLVKQVYTIELEPELVKFSKENLRKAGIKNVEVLKGDGSKGLSRKAPFNKIIVTCASDEIYPAWVNQLKGGGLILVPIKKGFYSQTLVLGKKQRGKLITRELMGVVFVPLRH
jgi:protein-L-isoaspartate(D-aspartate) O-methyltransferase